MHNNRNRTKITRIMSFSAAEQDFALPILDVKEVLPACQVILSPSNNRTERGMISSGDFQIPVFSLSQKLKPNALVPANGVDISRESLVLVANYRAYLFGLLIDFMGMIHSVRAEEWWLEGVGALSGKMGHGSRCIRISDRTFIIPDLPGLCDYRDGRANRKLVA